MIWNWVDITYHSKQLGDLLLSLHHPVEVDLRPSLGLRYSSGSYLIFRSTSTVPSRPVPYSINGQIDVELLGGLTSNMPQTSFMVCTRTLSRKKPGSSGAERRNCKGGWEDVGERFIKVSQ